MKIGRILYCDELVNHEKLDFIDYQKIDINNFSNIDTELPTLVVGWNLMKVINFNNISIDNNVVIKDKIYWEFSYNEHKSNHIDGVKKFVEKLPYYCFMSRYKYVNIDPVFHNINDTMDVFEYINGDIRAILNYKNEFMYILSDNIIFGININHYKFYNNDIDELELTLKKHSPIVVYDDGDYLSKYFRIFPTFIHLKRYLITILVDFDVL
jgi:hypothetical protein